MKVTICRTGNLSITENGHGGAVVDPIKGQVVYWDCTTPKASIQLAVRDYMDRPGQVLDWGRYATVNEGANR